IRSRFLNTGGDDIAEPGTQPEVAAARQDALELSCTAVVGYLENGSHFNHVSSPKTFLLRACPFVPPILPALPLPSSSVLYRPHAQQPDDRRQPAEHAAGFRLTPTALAGLADGIRRS